MSDEFCLATGRGRRRALGRELQDGDELLQSEFEDLGNFQKRLAVRNALQDLGQPRASSADNPDIAAFSRYALRRCTTWTNPTGLPGGASLSKAHRRWAPDRSVSRRVLPRPNAGLAWGARSGLAGVVYRNLRRRVCRALRREWALAIEAVTPRHRTPHGWLAVWSRPGWQP